MPTETIFNVTVVIAAFLCSLTAGFLFAFAVVVMPGTGRLADREFIRSFQVIDGVIQNNQPLFVLVWVGSVLAVLAAAVVGLGWIDGAERLLVVVAALAYLMGVQVPTARFNIPLNNGLEKLDVDTMDDEGLEAARNAFEPGWNRWNAIRTVIACFVSALLMVVLLGL